MSIGVGDRITRCLPAACFAFALLLTAGGARAEASTADGAPGERADTQARAKDDRSTGLSAEELLQRTPEPEDYVDEVRCIDSRRVRNSEVLDDQHVALRMRRDEYYLIQFERRCPGLRRGKPIMMEPRASRLCVHDSIRGMYEVGSSVTPGARCSIPGFQLITKEQLSALKDTIEAERRKKREAS